LVAREGLEPSKPLGRQIYSLLRLTAPQPRQLSLFGIAASCLPCGSDCLSQKLGLCAIQARGFAPMELAKGFEPPTG
jgi:hypothetical protein